MVGGPGLPSSKRGAKNIGIYGVFWFREREKSRKHRLFDAFWGFAKTVRLTILGGLQKVPTTKITTTTTTGPSTNSYIYNNNNNNHNHNHNHNHHHHHHDDDDDDDDGSQHVMSASSDEIPLSLSLPRPLQA